MIVHNVSDSDNFFEEPPTPTIQPVPVVTPDPIPLPEMQGIGEVQEVQEDAPLRKERVPKEGLLPTTDDFFADDSMEIQRIQTGNMLAKSTSPEQAARIIRLQENTGLAPNFIQDHLDVLEKEQISAGFEPSSFKEANPQLAQWMASNPYNHSLIKEDLGFFASIGQNAKAFYQGAASIPGQKEALALGYKRLEYGLTAEEDARLKELDKEAEASNWPAQNDTTSSYAARQFGNTLAQAAYSLPVAGKGAAKGATAAVAATLLGGPLTVPLIPSMAGSGAIVGSATELFFDSYQSEAGSAYTELINQKDLNGKPIADTESLKTVARGVGMINGAIELAGTAALAKIFPVTNYLQGMTKGKLVALVAESLKSQKKDMVIGALKKMTQSGLSEGAEEFFQALSGTAGKKVAQVVSGEGQEFAPIDYKEELLSAATQARDAGVGSFLVGGLGVASSGMFKKMTQVKEAKSNKEFYTALGEGVENSKTFKNLPEKGQEAIKEILKDGPYNTAHVDLEPFQTFFQSKGIDPREIAGEIFGGDFSVYDQAVESGHAIPIPMERYASKIAVNPEYSKFFVNEIRRDPDSMNFRESQDITQKLQALDEELSANETKKQQVYTDTQTALDSVNLVADEFTEKLLYAGVDQPTARTNADLIQRTFEQLGIDSGQAAKELLDKYNYSVERKEKYEEEGETLLQRGSKVQAEPVPTFYSKLTRELETKMGNSAPVQQVQGLIKDIKTEEREWSGIDELLKGKEKVTKQEVLDHLRANQLEIKEVTKGESVLSYKVTGFIEGRAFDIGSYPSKEKAEEAVSFRGDLDKFEIKEINQSVDEVVENTNDQRTKFSQYTLPGGENYKELLFTLPTGKTETYKSSHYSEENILAHTRFNDRIDSEGKKVLFIEEIQSDLHQDGRKKGYVGDKNVFKLQGNNSKEVYEQEYATREEAQKYLDDSNLSEAISIIEEKNSKGVTNLPFKKTWHEFVLKRMIRYAAENGYEKIGWTTGTQQAERYDLSKQVDSVGAVKNKDGTFDVEAYRDGKILHEGAGLNETALESQLGKDLAAKIIAESGEQEKSGYRIYKGADLKVGGSGMIGFYDKIIPDFLNKFGKKFGAKVEEVGIKMPEANYTPYVYEGPSYTVKELKDKLTTIDKESQRKLWEGVDELIYRMEMGNELARTLEVNENSSVAEHLGGKLIKDESKSQVKVHSLPITEALKDSALNEGFTLFQDKDGPQGSINIGDRSFRISLFKDMDKSTFLHEMGHSYLKVMTDLVASGQANERLQNNFKAALDWLGVESADKIGVKEHEQWARAYEAYLLRGQAPSNEMKSVFSKFTRWLKKIYQDIRALETKHGFKLSDDIIEVFDKMIASDEQIAAAKQAQGNQPLIDAMKSSGYSPETIEQVNALEAMSRIKAEEELSLKVMEDIARQRQAWWNAKSAEFREVIEAEINTRQDYNGLSLIENGTYADGRALPPGSASLKLSKEDLEKNYRLPKQAGLYKEGGQNVEVVASLLGFKSGQEMLNQFAAAEDKKTLIDRTTYQEMKKEYGDMTDDDEIRAEAEKKVHNDLNAEVNHKILEILASENQKGLKDLGQRVTARVPGIMAIRARAQEVIAAKNIGDIRPNLYKQAAVKASGQVLRSLTEGNVSEAFAAQYRKSLSEEMFKASVEAKEQIEKSLNKYKKFFKSDEALAKTREMNLVNAARAVLAEFGIGNADKSAEEYLKKFVEYGEDLDQVETITGYVTAATEGAAPYSLVSFDKFIEMTEAVDSLLELSKTTKEIEIDGKKMNRDEAIASLSLRLYELNGDGELIKDLREKFPNLAGKIDEVLEKNKGSMGEKSAVTDAEERKVTLLGIKSTLRRVGSWSDQMDGGDSQGVFRKFIYTPIKEASLKFRAEKSVFLKEYLEIVKGVEKSLTYQPIEASEIGYTFKDKAELLGALLHTGNESNLEKLLVGRKWGELLAIDVNDISRGDRLERTQWDAFIKRSIEEGLITKADYDFVQAVWDLNEKIKPQAQQAHKRMYGRYFNEITAKEFETPFGKYKGGYVPAVADPFFTEDAALRNEKEQLLKNNNSFMFPTTGRGSTKNRVEGYNVPLSLNLKYVPGHIDKMLRFIHLEPAVKDVSKIVMNKGFRATLKTFDPTVGADMLVPWLQRSAQQAISTPSTSRAGKAADNFFRTVRTNTGINIMAGNITNALQQFTGIFIGLVKVPFSNMRNALWNYVRNPKQTADDIIAKSAAMKERMTGNTFETMRHIDEILLNPDKYDQARDFSKKHAYFFQSAFQNAVDVIVWTGAYDQAVAKGLDEKASIREADSAVELTQGSSNPEEVSRWETGSPFNRAFTMFSGYFNMLSNLLGTETANIVRNMGLKKGAGRAFYVYSFGMMIPSVLNEILVRAMAGKGVPDDDDEEYLSDIMDIFFGSQFRTLTALIPVVGPVITAGVNRMNDKYYDDRISTSPIISMVESTVGVPVSIYKAITEDGNKKRAVRDTLTAIGLLSGFPVAPLAKPIGYGIDVMEGKAAPSGPIDITRGLITGKAGEPGS